MRNFGRKFGITVAATAVSLGLLGVSAPAEAKDTSWGYVVHNTPGF